METFVEAVIAQLNIRLGITHTLRNSEQIFSVIRSSMS